MEHVDGTSWRPTGGATRHPPGPRPDRPGAGVTAARWIAAGVGLALTLAVGAATVTTVLVEAGHEPATAPPATATASTTPIDPGPATLRLWGLRPTREGGLVPVTPSDPLPRTVLEQLDDDLLLPSPR